MLTNYRILKFSLPRCSKKNSTTTTLYTKYTWDYILQLLINVYVHKSKEAVVQ